MARSKEPVRSMDEEGRPTMSISPAMSGVLHENHKALIARGPWRFDVMEPARYVATPGAIGPTFESIPYTKLKRSYWPKVADPFA